MIRVVAIMVLVVFLPMQLYAVDLGGFSTDTQIEYNVPRSGDTSKKWYGRDQERDEKVVEGPPKSAAGTGSGTNWWLWGGLAVVIAGVAVLAGGGGGSSAKTQTGSSLITW